jgi:hypothetical protein
MTSTFRRRKLVWPSYEPKTLRYQSSTSNEMNKQQQFFAKKRSVNDLRERK